MNTAQMFIDELSKLPKNGKVYDQEKLEQLVERVRKESIFSTPFESPSWDPSEFHVFSDGSKIVLFRLKQTIFEAMFLEPTMC